ncbi:MAG: hypothetical protein JRJ05_10945 [Deltaproteobacteria bacterium]|nr:hypothetical protein [Deltaproteobacteria bacterium]MBW2692797.1 hypothetical protein [Deltaproteobacteria bacterium]
MPTESVDRTSAKWASVLEQSVTASGFMDGEYLTACGCGDVRFPATLPSDGLVGVALD